MKLLKIHDWGKADTDRWLYVTVRFHSGGLDEDAMPSYYGKKSNGRLHDRIRSKGRCIDPDDLDML